MSKKLKYIMLGLAFLLISSISSADHQLFILDKFTGRITNCPLNFRNNISYRHCRALDFSRIRPTAINISPNNQYLYISSNINDQIYRCQVNDSGIQRATCRAQHYSSPVSMAFDKRLSNPYVYIANSRLEKVERCIVQPNGLFTDCEPTGSGTYFKLASISTSGPSQQSGQYYVYIATLGAIAVCPIDQDYKLGDCKLMYGAKYSNYFTHPIAVAGDPHGKYIYILDSYSFIQGKFTQRAPDLGGISCKVSADGSSIDNSCTLDLAPVLKSPTSIVLTPQDDYAYIATEDEIEVCKMVDGRYQECRDLMYDMVSSSAGFLGISSLAYR